MKIFLRFGNPGRCEKILDEAKKENQKLFEAVNDFCIKNDRTTNNLKSIGTLSVRHVALDEKQILEILGGGWESLQKKYPGSEGFIMLSRPGFSKDGTISVIFMYHSYSAGSGISQYYIMEKKDEKWIKSSMYIGSAIYSR